MENIIKNEISEVEMTCEKVFVSIIVPVYNAEKYLDRCLKSLVNQTLKNIEIICVDDGSVDHSLEIINKYALQDCRIKVFPRKNMGCSAARNFGIDVAQGEYVAFVDADDWVDLNFYEKLYASAYKSDADIAVAGIVRLNKRKKKYFLRYEQEVISENVEDKFILCDVPAQNYVWNKIYKLSEIRLNNLRFVEGRYYEDIIFSPQVLYYLKKLVVVPNVFYYYWRTPGSIVSHRDGVWAEDYLYATEIANNFMADNGMDITKFQSCVKRYRFLGLTLFKSITKRDTTKYYLFNVCIYSVRCKKFKN